MRENISGKTIIHPDFFHQNNVIDLAKQLLGKRVVSTIGNKTVSGIINETEAYAGITDKASHAYNNRRSARTEIMYRNGGHLYLYLCYGIHTLLNIVTNKEDIPDAILIRSIVPQEGIDIITRRRKVIKKKPYQLTNGPGKVTVALNLSYQLSGIMLSDENRTESIRIEEGIQIDPHFIQATPRIGIQYAQEDIMNPWRFIVSPEKVEKIIRDIP